MSDQQTSSYFAVIPEFVVYGCTPRAIQVYGLIQRHTDRERKAWPGRERLAELADTSVKTIDRAIAELETVGAIIKEKRPGTSNMYRLPAMRYEGGDTSDQGGDTSVPTGGDISVPTGGDTSVSLTRTILNENQLNDTSAGRNELWDTLVTIFGKPPASQRSMYGKVVKELHDLGATGEDIQLRAVRLVDTWGPGKLTINSLLKHWARFGTDLARLNESDVAAFKLKATLADWEGNGT